MWSRFMFRNELDFMHLEELRSDARKTRPELREEPQSDNSPEAVLWEMGLVLVGALSAALAINAALILFHIV
jgi:hypothetical protein